MNNGAIGKILLVDDSQVSRQILKSCISKSEQYEFHEVADGVAALEVFRRVRPDLTFLDINMPNMNGMACLGEIRKIDDRALVVMCSSEIQAETAKDAAALGALAVVRKPPTRESIGDALEKAMQALRAARP